MRKLLQIEFKKILTYKIFWILAGLYFLFLSLGILMAEFMINNMVDNMNRHMPIPFPHVGIYFFPWVWQNITFFATIRYVLIFPATIIIILVTNEFTFKTIRQNIINGMSKAEFIISKLLVILLISIVMTVLVALVTFIIGVLHTSEISISIVIQKSTFILGFFITILSFQIYALFIGFLFRNTGLSIALFTMYVTIVEPVIYYTLKNPHVFENNISRYLPVNTVLRVTEYPAIPILKQVMGLNLQESVSLGACCLSLLYSAVMMGIIFIVIEKRDL